MHDSFIRRVRRKLRPVRAVWENIKGHVALVKIRRHLRSGYRQEPHGLPGELIVSLTTFPPRYGTVRPTLECLLSQSIKPDRVILWIAHEDKDMLPDDLKNLTAKGLEIRTTDNIRSFKKIIPVLREFPEAFIVTADDDVYYHPDWLKILVESWDGRNNQIVCHKAYRIVMNAEGVPVPYNFWKWNVKGPAENARLFPVGVGGILYPPGSLAMPEVLDEETFMKLVPKSNDLWLYWMGRKAGSVCKTTHYNKLESVWPGSQSISLSAVNTGKHTGESDYESQIKNMIEAYGFL